MPDHAATEEPEDEVDPLIGAVLGGRYLVERKLGEGGMGAVYVGQHQTIGKQVAIKCLNPLMAANKAIVERFKREARAATAAGNEHIIDVTDMGELPDGSPYIVMELLDGRELAELIAQEGPLPIGRAVRILLQICDALIAAHAKGIVHRDLKPENVFLVRRKRDADFVKVLDFGIARFNEPAAIGGGKNLTATGMTIGTPHYMAPEQAQGLEGLDHRADIYALGVILYEMLTGDTPFDAETFALLVVKIVTTDPPLIRDRRPDVPVGLETLIMRCLSKDKNLRPQSVEELAQALEAYVELDAPPKLLPGPDDRATVRPPGRDPKPKATQETRSGVRATKPTAPGSMAEESEQPSGPATPTEIEEGLTRGGRLPWLALAAGGLVAVAGIAALLLTKPDGDEPPEPPQAREAPTPPAPADPPHDSPTDPPRDRPEDSPTRSPTNPSAAQADEVRLRVLVAPNDAHIFLNGTEFPNPLDAMRPRSLEPVRLRIEREGYRPLEELVVLDRDRELIRTLEAAPGRGRRHRRESMERASMDPPSSASSGGSMQDETMAPPPTEARPPAMRPDYRDDF